MNSENPVFTENMQSDLKKFIENIHSSESFDDLNQIYSDSAEFFEGDEWYDPNADDDECMSSFKAYYGDLGNIISAVEDEESLEVLVYEVLKSTETDVLTYLENYVSDDTDYSSVLSYIQSGFDSPEDFVLNLSKNYFNNGLIDILEQIKNRGCSQ